MPGGAAHADFGIHEFAHCHRARAYIFAELPHVGSGADVASTEFTVEHGTAREHERRQIATGSAHEKRGRSLVATGEQYNSVQRVGADGFLPIHAYQMAEEHRGW